MFLPNLYTIIINMPYDRNIPYNELPLLHPDEGKVIDTDVLKKWGIARAALAKLDGITNTLEDPQIMVNTISLQEAKESSKIENIVTTTDALYEAIALSTTENTSPTAKEVLRYRESLMEAYKELALEEVKNSAHLHNVSNQRELLIDFFMKYLNDTAKYNESVEPSDIVDKYLKGNL